MNLNSPGTIGNIMSRLGTGMKNVRPRRVIPGAEFLQELEDVDNDISGTSQPLPNFANFQSPAQNQPESDLGGEITPQSYDVRANTAIPPSSAEEEGFGATLRKLGASLYDSFKEGWTPGISDETRQQTGISQPQEPISPEPSSTNELPAGTYMHAGISPPPSWTPPPEQSAGLGGALMDYINPTKREQMTEYNKDLMNQAQLRAQGQNPDEVLAEKHAKYQEEVKKAMENPMQVGAYGAAEEVANNPILQAEFQKYTGINYDEQIASEVSRYEEAMNGIEDEFNGLHDQLSDQAEQIKQRIQNNQSTDADKYYIGLALLMPLIIGGFFGKEAALGALGGGAKGIADVLAGRQKGNKEDEAALMDINKQQIGIQEKLGNLGLEKAKLEPFIRKNLPEDPLAHLIGMEKAPYTNPHTGKTEDVYEVLPGFVAPEKYINTEKGRERMEKAASELSETKTYVNQVNDLTSNVMEILAQVKDKPFWKKAHIPSLTALFPGALSGLTDKVKWKGEMVPAGPLLENELGILANQYAHAQDLGQLDRAAQAHMEKLIGNPTKTLLSPKDVETQIMNVRQFVQNELINKTKNKGFISDFVERDMNEVNNPLHGKLNQRQQDRRTAEIEKKLAQEETNYAK